MTQEKIRLLGLMLVLILGWFQVQIASAAPTYTQIIVFGDSGVDSGYYRALPAPSPGSTTSGGIKFNELWPAAVAAGAGAPTSSPGKVWPQVLAAYFGLTANPSNQGGTNYATSGAKNVVTNTGATGGFRAAIPTVTQISSYLSEKGNRVDPDALYIISSGNNDIVYAAGTNGATGPFPSDPQAFVTDSARSLADAIAKLKAAGGTNFLVNNQYESYPTGDTGNNPKLRQLKSSYNSALFSALTEKQVAYIKADTNALLVDIYANPSKYGFTSTFVSNGATTACVPPAGLTTSWALLCSSDPNAPSKFAFADADKTRLWADNEHFSTGGHKAHADYIYALLNNKAAECLFTWAEQNYPSLLPTSGAVTKMRSPYYFRYYPATNSYLGVSSADNHVYYLGANGLMDLGGLSTWLSTAGCSS